MFNFIFDVPFFRKREGLGQMSIIRRIGRCVKVGGKFGVYNFGQSLQQECEAVRDGVAGGRILFRPERDEISAGPKSVYRFVLFIKMVVHFYPFCASAIV